MNLFNNTFIALFALFNFIIFVDSNKKNNAKNQEDDKVQQDDDDEAQDDGYVSELLFTYDNDSARQVFNKKERHNDDNYSSQQDTNSGKQEEYSKYQQDDYINNQADENVIMPRIYPTMEMSSSIWENGVVPYRIDKKSYDPIIIDRIRRAMNEIMRSSCVVFMDLDVITINGFGLNNFLLISNPNQERDCSHQVNIGPDDQAMLVLGFECMEYHQILHSLMHVLGFKDEVTHPHRNRFVRVVWENIQPKYQRLFHVNMAGTPQKTLVEYDTTSIMHFHDRAYTVNSRPTVIPLIPGLAIFPTRRLSQLDVMKLRLAFGHECNKRKVGDVIDTCKLAMQASED